MDCTKDLYDEMFLYSTSKVEAAIYAVLLPFVAIAELVKNGMFILCNAGIAVIHTVGDLLKLISEVWSGCFGDTNQINPIACGVFSAPDLETLKAALRVTREKTDVWLQHLPYQMWFDQTTQTVNIKEQHTFERTLSVKIIDGGLIESITLNGEPQNAFPQDFEACMWPCFTRALEVSSVYAAQRIRVIQQGLVETPDFHLKKLAETLNHDRRPDMNVSFLTPQLKTDVGQDQGGLSRDYFDDLFKGLTLNKGELLFEARDGSDLKMPVTREERITPAERSLYEKMGQAMMYVYGSRGQLLTGRRFEDALFSAAFSLTPAEINADLTDATRLKMCRAIFTARGVQQNIVADLTLEGALDYCGRSLAPIHAIAKGIQAAKNRWDRNQNIEAQAFSDRIQGSIDRNAIANALQLPGSPTHHLTAQVHWLREWIRDPNTPLDHLRDFLKFATGSSSLPQGQPIKVKTQNAPYVPTLVGHSCFSQIDIAPVGCDYGYHNNRTKAKFIEALALALTNPGDYSMA